MRRMKRENPAECCLAPDQAEEKFHLQLLLLQCRESYFLSLFNLVNYLFCQFIDLTIRL